MRRRARRRLSDRVDARRGSQSFSTSSRSRALYAFPARRSPPPPRRDLAGHRALRFSRAARVAAWGLAGRLDRLGAAPSCRGGIAWRHGRPGARLRPRGLRCEARSCPGDDACRANPGSAHSGSPSDPGRSAAIRVSTSRGHTSCAYESADIPSRLYVRADPHREDVAPPRASAVRRPR